ncbi:MAG: GYD domain-containing protein [Candidatus Odinarchaeota archaeon]
MPIYITLMKLTAQGVKNIKDAPKRIESGIKYLERLGGKLLAFYVTFGEYDYIGIAEAPNDEVAMRFLLGLGSAGNVKTTTLKAYSKEEFVKVVEKVP